MCISQTEECLFFKLFCRNDYHTAPNVCNPLLLHSYWFCSLMGEKLKLAYVDRGCVKERWNPLDFIFPQAPTQNQVLMLTLVSKDKEKALLQYIGVIYLWNTE